MGQVFFVITEIGGDLRHLDMLAAAPFDIVHNIVVELLLLGFSGRAMLTLEYLIVQLAQNDRGHIIVERFLVV
ncbi:hypothetical protein D3C80_1940990 [compost metagenome]